ncbi:MAG: hypothetical protein QM589_05120 [Thermomicrobiales bacterium]
MTSPQPTGTMASGPVAGNPETRISLLGGINLDLTQATFSSPTISIQLVSGLGGVHLKVPRGVRVEVEGIRLIGGRSDNGAPEEFDGRTVRATSWGIMGGTSIERV